MRLPITIFATLCLSTSALAAPKVIASVMPVYGIVAAVMGDAGQPELLLKGSMSEHRASFTPLQVADLGKADLVFIVSHGLEAKLAQISGSEAVNGKTFIELADAPGVRHLAIRAGGAWEAHNHAAEAQGDGGGHDGVLAFDPHVWLDPENAKAMAQAIAAELTRADSANAIAYAANAKAFSDSLDALSQSLAAQLAPVKDKPFVVFHDAYQYFENRFGLNAVGSITDVSARAPSVQRLEDIRGRIGSAKAVCVFREPQYDGRTVSTVNEGLGAREGVIDPLGASLTPARDSYQKLLQSLGDTLAACLKG